MGEMTPSGWVRSSSLPFNTPLESGLRSTVILAEAAPAEYDLQRLITYDYLLVHSADIGGPTSLHPASPNRTGELLVRRRLVEAGVKMMIRKGLITPRFRSSGIFYRATAVARLFLDYFESEYAMRARVTARWLQSTCGDLSDSELRELVETNLGRWGTEFTIEPAFEEDANV